MRAKIVLLDFLTGISIFISIFLISWIVWPEFRSDLMTALNIYLHGK